jgi:hypothetical protein
MISDWKIELLAERLKQGKSLASAAREVGISYSSGQKYKKSGKVPSELHAQRDPKRVKLFEDHWEKYVAPKLKRDPALPATKLLNQLIQKHPDIFNQNMLRTLQRRIQKWKRNFKPSEREDNQFLSHPGSACVFELYGFTGGLTLRSQRVPGTLFLFYLPFSKWIYIEPIRERKLPNILQSLEEALWTFGFVPRALLNVDQSNRTILSSNPNSIRPGLYAEFCRHYSMHMQESLIVPPDIQHIKDLIRAGYKKHFKEDKNITDFKKFNDYRSTIISLATQVNSHIKKELLIEEKRSARELPNQGFSNWAKTYNSAPNRRIKR